MGEGWGEGAVSPSNVIRIDSSTESISSSTSLFQYRITLNPRELSHAVLGASDVRCSWWWPPSISMTSLLSGQTKSTMYLPIGDCLLNLRPNSLRSRSLDQRSRSASVHWFLSSPSPQPSLIKGEGVAQRSPSEGMTGWGAGRAFDKLRPNGGVMVGRAGGPVRSPFVLRTSKHERAGGPPTSPRPNGGGVIMGRAGGPPQPVRAEALEAHERTGQTWQRMVRAYLFNNRQCRRTGLTSRAN